MPRDKAMFDDLWRAAMERRYLDNKLPDLRIVHTEKRLQEALSASRKI